jgi:hypothetical protein
MAWPRGEHRALTGIEKSMRPDRVAGKFVRFGHLASSDPMPVAEQIAHVIEAAHALEQAPGSAGLLVTVFAIPAVVGS